MEHALNRRTFFKSLSAICVAANARFSTGACLLNRADLIESVSGEGLFEGLVPLPSHVIGVQYPVMDLSGKWKINMDPSSELPRVNVDTSFWKEIEIPNEFATQGCAIEPDREYPCCRSIRIPPDFVNRRIFLRFDGVYSYARIWVNGTYIRDHFGGFTAWDCEITEHVKAGEEAELIVGVTDRSDDISQGSSYAKHPIAGILRDVRLFSVPQTYLSSLALTVTLGEGYKNGHIRISPKLSSPAMNPARLELKLTDDSGRTLAIQPNSVSLEFSDKNTPIDIVALNPKRWDAEHPNLYTLEMSVIVDGVICERVRRTIGFRTVERVGNQLLVNGKSVKLRGVCRHSVHPVYGRAVPAEFDETDAKIFRAGNINFVRTSHYPPSERFLEACDRHGIYVEEETAVCWSNVEKGPSSDPKFTARFLSQFGEMIARDRDHVSVLFWSLGNESQWGTNIALEHRFAAEHDSSRPTIFSYPDTAPLPLPFDIYSKHYASVNSDLSSNTNPVLNDEFAHVSCYNLQTLRRDPGVRAFWGQSIRSFGEKFISTEGCLGGAIWAGIDEVFLLPNGPVGYGPWGLIDGWRREKPEYWLTKKAYSPVRIDDRPIPVPENGSPLIIPIHNAFDHTDLNEITILWSCGSKASQVLRIDLPPHESGCLEIPALHWKSGDALQMVFLAGNAMIDQFRIPIGQSKPSIQVPKPASVEFEKSAGSVEITGPRFSVVFSQATGLISEARFNNQLVVAGGPYLDLGGGPIMSNWLLKEFTAALDGDAVQIHTSGECKLDGETESVVVEFEIRVDGSGLISTTYRLHGEKQGNPQLGIAYILPSTIEKLAWNRSSLWSVYPEDHIGRPQGVALKIPNHAMLRYQIRPEWPWSEDVGDFFLWGKENCTPQASNDFRSLKENVWYAACVLSEGNIRVRAEGAADIAARADVLPNGQIAFSLYNFWPYPDLQWGNYTGVEAAPAITTHEVKIRLTDWQEEL